MQRPWRHPRPADVAVEPSETLPVLALTDLRLTIGGVEIVAGVTLDVRAGEFVGVIGPNGAGKTTLFNLLSGLVAPSAGTIRLAGHDVTRQPPHRRTKAGLGRTFQTSSVFPRLPVVENVRLAAQAHLGGSLGPLRRVGVNDRATQVALRCLERVELAHRAALPAGALSHGEKRKLEIAILLAGEPAVILLDEPMAGMSAADVPDLTEVIRRVHREDGRTVLMVEHHMHVVLTLADRVAVMHHGALLAFDTPQAVMSNPLVQQAYLGSPL